MTTLNRKIAPPIHDAIEFKYNLQPINKEALDNGIPFYWLNAGVQDVVEIDWVFPAGMWQEPKPAVANATAGLLKNGTSKHSAHQIHESVEYYGASLKVNTGNDFSTVSLYALTKDLPKLLPIIHELLTDSVFPEEEVTLHKQNAIQRLLVSLRQADFVANQKIDALLFGEFHPYGRFTRREKIEAVTREDLLGFFKRNYTLANARIFMAGKVGRDEVALVNDLFGKTPVVAAPLEEVPFGTPAPSEQSHRVMNDETSVQASIRIGRTVPTRHHPDFPKMVVLNTMLGGYFGSRLMSNIREDKGYTYGIYSSLQPMVHGGSLTIHTEVGRDVMEDAIREVYKEMNDLCTAPAAEEELLLVKNYLLGGLLGDLDGPFKILGRWRTLILHGLDEAHFNNNIRVYKEVTAAELQALAQEYYNKSLFYEVGVI
jgi:predicted Zn-dependent peptidase